MTERGVEADASGNIVWGRGTVARAVCWRLHRDDSEAICRLLRQADRWELLIEIDGRTRQRAAFKAQQAWVAAALKWKDVLAANGWN